MSQPPPDEPVQSPYFGPPATEPPPSGYQPRPTYGAPNEYGQPPANEPQAYGQPAYAPPAYGQPPVYGQPPAYGEPPAYGQAPAYGQPPPYGPPPTPAKRSRRAIWIAAAVVVVLVVAAIVAVAVTHKSSSNSTATPKSVDIATVAVPDGPGVIYRSPKGHFAARFPEAPDEKAVNGTTEGVGYTVYLAADTNSHTVIEAVGLSEKIPASVQDELLDGIVEGASSSSGLAAGTSSDITFQGHHAQLTQLTSDDGTDIALLAFIYSDQRMYLLLAPSGDGIKNLEASFVAAP
jgi:hypothetical protein